MGFLSNLFGGNKEDKALREALGMIHRIIDDEKYQLELLNPLMKEMHTWRAKGSRRWREFFDGSSMALRKTTHVLRAALRVCLPSPPLRMGWGQNPEQRQHLLPIGLSARRGDSGARRALPRRRRRNAPCAGCHRHTAAPDRKNAARPGRRFRRRC